MQVKTLAISLSLLPGCCLAPPARLHAETIRLEQAVREACEHNRDFVAERAGLPVAEARLQTARLRPNPTLSLSADHLDWLGTGFTEANGGGPSEVAVSTEFTWERAGKRSRRMALAEKERALVEWELKERRRRLIFEVQNTFIDVMVAREHRNVAGENLSFMKRIVGVNEARLKAGDLSEVEVIRSQVAAEQMESALQQAELALRLSQNRLLLLMGRSGESGLPEADGEFRRDSETASPQEARQSALAGRPDLRAAAAEEERAEADLALQKALRRGDLELGTEYRRQQGVNGMGNSLGFTVNVPLPLFDRNQGELARAAAERNRAALRTAALRAAILSEVATALDQQATARQQLERIESVLLKKAREVREVTEYAYQRGEASLLELLDAEKAYMETMQSYALARAEYSRSSYWIDAVTAKDGSK